jgi:hypothetical protein
MKWTDENIDKLFQSEAGKLSFEYKDAFWNEFNASSLAGTQTWTDQKIDALYRESAAKVTIPYKNEYWVAFNASMPIYIPANGPIAADSEIDSAYKSSAEGLSFAYQPSYWNEMEAMLDQQKARPDFLWFGAAFSSVAVLLLMLFTQKPLDLSIRGLEPIVMNFGLSEVVNTASEYEVQEEQTPVQLSVDNLVFPDFTWDPTAGMGLYQMPTCGGVIYSPNGLNGLMPGEQFINGGLWPQLPGSGNQDLQTKDDLTRLEANGLENGEGSNELATREAYQGETRVQISPFIQGLGGLSQSLITPSESMSTSYGVGAGIELTKGNWSFGFGLNGLVENHNDLQLNRTAKVYGFGSEVYQHNLDYQRLYKLEGVLSAGYYFGKHRVDIGVRPSYVFSSKVRIQEQGDLNTIAPEQLYNESREVYGFMEGVKRFGVKPTIGYAYSIKPGMTIGLNVGVELMPSINEDYINGVNNTLPIDGQIYFRRSLSFRK